MNITDDSVAELRRILKKDSGMKVSTARARRIGEWLIQFYSHLSDNQKGTSECARLKEQSTDTNFKNSN